MASPSAVNTANSVVLSGAPAPSPVRAGEGAGAPLRTSFTPEGDAIAMGDALVKAIENPMANREVVEQFRAARTGERLDRYFTERRRARAQTYSGGR